MAKAWTLQGGTGHWPVLPGYQPGCAERGALWETVFACQKSASPVPSSGSPDGTGQWPVPPWFATAR